MFRLLIAGAIVALLVVVNFSFPLADWWGRNVHIAGRPATGELDVHVVLWLVIGVVVSVLAGRWISVRGPLGVLLVLGCVSAAVEFLQPRVTLRTFEWTDLVGNTAGLLLAGVVLTRFTAVRRVAGWDA